MNILSQKKNRVRYSRLDIHQSTNLGVFFIIPYPRSFYCSYSPALCLSLYFASNIGCNQWFVSSSHRENKNVKPQRSNRKASIIHQRNTKHRFFRVGLYIGSNDYKSSQYKWRVIFILYNIVSLVLVFPYECLCETSCLCVDACAYVWTYWRWFSFTGGGTKYGRGTDGLVSEVDDCALWQFCLLYV